MHEMMHAMQVGKQKIIIFFLVELVSIFEGEIIFGTNVNWI